MSNYIFSSARRGYIYQPNGALFCVTKEKHSIHGIVVETKFMLKSVGIELSPKEILDCYAENRLIQGKYYLRTRCESRPHRIKKVKEGI